GRHGRQAMHSWNARHGGNDPRSPFRSALRSGTACGFSIPRRRGYPRSPGVCRHTGARARDPPFGLMRLLVDMNLTPRWIGFLIAAGHDAAHWSSIGAGDAKDPEIFNYAREHDRILLTNDLDFPRILANMRDTKPSVVLLRGEPLVPEHRGRALVE